MTARSLPTREMMDLAHRFLDVAHPVMSREGFNSFSAILTDEVGQVIGRFKKCSVTEPETDVYSCYF
jgi:hypothetical protein